MPSSVRIHLAVYLICSKVMLASIVLALSSFACGQNLSFGYNSFAAGHDGTIFLLFDKALYRNTTVAYDEWTPIGNNIRLFAVAPQDDKILYVVNDQGQISKSLDGGQKWITLNPQFSNVQVLCVYVSPANSQEVFVGTTAGLFKTNDGGFSWRATSLQGPVSQFVLNTTANSQAYALVDQAIFSSSDSGTTWKRSDSGVPLELVRGIGRTASRVPAKVSLLILANEDKPFLLAATVGKGILRSDDQAGSWKTSGFGLPDQEVFTRAIVSRGSIVLASSIALYSSSDGNNWRKLPVQNTSYTPTSLFGVIQCPRHDGLLLGFRFPSDSDDRRRLAYLDSHGVLVGLNYGVLPHSEIDSLWGGSINGRTAIFAAVANLNYTDQTPRWSRPTYIYGSLDGGYSWVGITDTRCGEQGLTRKAAPSEMWVYGKSECVLKSSDGASWTRLPGFNPRYGNATMSQLEPDSKDRNLLYYSVGVNEHYIYRYLFDPETHQGQTVDLRTVANEMLVAEDDNKMLFTDTLQLSTDAGWTWTDKSTVLNQLLGEAPALSTRTIRLLSFQHGIITILVSEFDRMSGAGSANILQSGDLGSTWEQIGALPGECPPYAWNDWPKVFANPDDSSNFFAVIFDPGSSDEAALRVVETKNRGRSWQDIYSYPVRSDERQSAREVLKAVTQIPGSSKRGLLVGGEHGLWKSEDEGHSWKRLGGVQ
jgi:photosystem II stability/assembly factor-like uncharacterized protein